MEIQNVVEFVGHCRLSFVMGFVCVQPEGRFPRALRSLLNLTGSTNRTAEPIRGKWRIVSKDDRAGTYRELSDVRVDKFDPARFAGFPIPAIPTNNASSAAVNSMRGDGSG